MAAKETRTAEELLHLLLTHLHAFPSDQSGPHRTAVGVTPLLDGDWTFDLPADLNDATRGAIIREQAVLRTRYNLQPDPGTGRKPYVAFAYGKSGGYGVAGAYGDLRSVESAFDGGTFQPDALQISGGGRISDPRIGTGAVGELGVNEAPINGEPQRPDARFELQGASAKSEPAPFVPDTSTFNDAAQAPAERLRRQGADFLARATSGPTDPLSPNPAGNILISTPPVAGTVPTVDNFIVAGGSPAAASREPIAKIIIANISQNRDVIAISTAVFRSLLDVRIGQISDELTGKNDPDAIAALEQERSRCEALKQQTLNVQRIASQDAEASERQEAAVAASISLAQGIKNWWTEKHVSICESTFKTSLFLAGAGVSCALGLPVLGAGVCGVLAGGEPVAHVLAAMFGKGKE